MRIFLTENQIQAYNKMFNDGSVEKNLVLIVQLLQNENPLDHIMGVSGASEKWGLEQSTIKKMCQRGELPAIKIGDTWIIRKDQERPNVKERAKKMTS